MLPGGGTAAARAFSDTHLKDRGSSFPGTQLQMYMVRVVFFFFAQAVLREVGCAPDRSVPWPCTYSILEHLGYAVSEVETMHPTCTLPSMVYAANRI